MPIEEQAAHIDKIADEILREYWRKKAPRKSALAWWALCLSAVASNLRKREAEERRDAAITEDTHEVESDLR